MKYVVLLILFCSFVKAYISAQEITEKEYLRVDSILWCEYESRQNQIWNEIENYPHKRDSLRSELASLLEKIMLENVELAIQYSSTPSGLKRVFMTRNLIEKNRLDSIFKNLPASMKNKTYGELIKEYIDTDQLKEGDSFMPFECFLPDGSLFDWKETNFKKILLVFSGLGCMGPDGRNIIKQWVEAGWTIIDYHFVDTLEKLKEEASIYDLGNIHISDFKGDSSPMKIKYNAQAAPTCYLIDEDGTIRMISVGVTAEIRDAIGVELKF